jgi:hypothetical protein
VINTEKSIALSFHTWQNKIPLKPRIIFNNRDVNYSTEIKFLNIHITMFKMGSSYQISEYQVE